jgi:riboflavin synthase
VISMARVGIVDTMFARADMGAMALEEMKTNFPDVEVIRRTVPGVKDLPVECKKLLDDGCDACMALGMVGGAPVDQVCAHEASMGIQHVKVQTSKHVVEAFVHENEAWSGREFREICENRVRKHVHNAVLLIRDPKTLTEQAGKGIRQGKDDEGPVKDSDEIVLGFVLSRFNEKITERMKRKAIETAGAEGIKTRIITVPGVFDMPLVVKKMLMDKGISGVVTLGAVVKGGTAHDEVIAKDTAKRLGTLSLEYCKPVTLGIIGHGAGAEEAEKRAEDYAQRAVMAAIELVKTLRE